VSRKKGGRAITVLKGREGRGRSGEIQRKKGENLAKVSTNFSGREEIKAYYRQRGIGGRILGEL